MSGVTVTLEDIYDELKGLSRSMSEMRASQSSRDATSQAFRARARSVHDDQEARMRELERKVNRTLASIGLAAAAVVAWVVGSGTVPF